MKKPSLLSSYGINFICQLTIVFILLRVIGLIHWSCLWVFSPLIFGMSIYAIIAAVVAIAYYWEKKHPEHQDQTINQ